MALMGCRVGEVWIGQHQVAKFLMGATSNNERITTLRQTAANFKAIGGTVFYWSNLHPSSYC